MTIVQCVDGPWLTAHLCMAFAEGFPSLHEKTFALQILLAESAVKALAVVVVVEGFDPPVAGFYGEPARHTLGCEQVIPIFFTVGQSVFKVKWRVGKDLATVSANKTLRMKCLAHCLQTVLYMIIVIAVDN